MKLITELYDNSETEILTEANTGKKAYYIKGIFAQAEQPNRNKRIYPKAIMEREIEKFSKMIEERRSLGELNHPPYPNIDAKQASHLITELSWDGNNIIGKAKIINTPSGDIVKALLDEGVKLGVSTRGLGSLKTLNNGLNEVQSDFTLSTVDIVSDPSAHDAWVQGIMEGAEWVNVNGNWVIAEQAKNLIKTASVQEIAENQAKWFSEFLKRLK